MNEISRTPEVYGTAIAFFIGFINNEAYDRWWEARKIWGALVNDSRSWSRAVQEYLNHPDQIARDSGPHRPTAHRVSKRAGGIAAPDGRYDL